MNPAFVYRQHGRSIFWIAFMSALAIHLGAVALAKTKSPSIKLQDVSPLPDVEVVDTAEPEAALLEESAPPPPLEQIHPDQDRFQEENLTPPPIRASEGAATVPYWRNNGVVAFGESEGGVCAAPGISVRSASPTSYRIWHRVAHGRSNLRDCD
jgi:hypothetical protein